MQKQKISNGVKDTISDIKIKTEEMSGDAINTYSARGEKLDEYLSQKNSGSENPVFIPTEPQYKPSGLIKFLGYAAKIVVIFLLGGFGGIWMEHEIIPVLATKSPFSQYEFFKKIKDRTIIINRTEEVKISEDTAALDMIRKTNPSVVKIVANYAFQEKPPKGKKKAVLAEVSEKRNLNGVIITSDGLVMTSDPKVFTTDRAKFDLKGATYKVNYGEKEFVVSDPSGIRPYDLQEKSSDPRMKAVLLKISAANLPVIALASPNNVEVGQKAFALGGSLFSGIVSDIKTESGVKFISIDNVPSADYFGSGPLVNLRGELLGINIVGADGKPTARFISIDDLKSFINSAIGV